MPSQIHHTFSLSPLLTAHESSALPREQDKHLLLLLLAARLSHTQLLHTTRSVRVVRQEVLQPRAPHRIFPLTYILVCVLGGISCLALAGSQPGFQSCGGFGCGWEITAVLPALPRHSTSRDTHTQRLPFGQAARGIRSRPHTVVSVFCTVRLRRCCHISLFSLRYLRGRERTRCSVTARSGSSAQTPSRESNG